PELPALQPGKRYLLDTVIRTVKMGHPFTQGTADSNEVWLELTVKSGERMIGKSGGMGKDNEVEPWTHFADVSMLDRNGHRMERRNVQEIFVPLYNHQKPPGAADVIHCAFELPEGLTEPVTIEAKLNFRKFDTTYVRQFRGDKFTGNDLTIMELASDSLTLPVSGHAPAPAQEGKPAPATKVEPWERWNDYGIGLLRKAGTTGFAGELRQSEDAFKHVEELGKADGPLNLGRVYLREGRLDEAAT